MGRAILLAVLLGSVVLVLLLPATTFMTGWKKLLPPLLWVGTVLAIWSCLSIYLPR